MAELHVIGVTHDLGCPTCVDAIRKAAESLDADSLGHYASEARGDEGPIDSWGDFTSRLDQQHRALVTNRPIATVTTDEHGDLTITPTDPHHPNHDHRGARGGGEEPTVAETEKTFIPDVEQAQAEHGVRLPNGREVWDRLLSPISGADLTTEEGQGKTLDNWKSTLESIGLEYDEDEHELVFLRRYTTLARTKVECF